MIAKTAVWPPSAKKEDSKRSSSRSRHSVTGESRSIDTSDTSSTASSRRRLHGRRAARSAGARRFSVEDFRSCRSHERRDRYRRIVQASSADENFLERGRELGTLSLWAGLGYWSVVLSAVTRGTKARSRNATESLGP